ncbi:hypothetical protein ATO3_06515 [Marinibacterium profundimaris]|uniref:Uncharacterized protein n=1 Tax=Marinibacterium profundimaris TaxID=1679460 RepID=A0A225NMT2_9RHOB|nr:hypothetical protein ATO3_06515 [Marinibacterium profundimaris]
MSSPDSVAGTRGAAIAGARLAVQRCADVDPIAEGIGNDDGAQAMILAGQPTEDAQPGFGSSTC